MSTPKMLRLGGVKTAQFGSWYQGGCVGGGGRAERRAVYSLSDLWAGRGKKSRSLGASLIFQEAQISSSLKLNDSLLNSGVSFKITVIDPLDLILEGKGAHKPYDKMAANKISQIDFFSVIQFHWIQPLGWNYRDKWLVSKNGCYQPKIKMGTYIPYNLRWAKTTWHPHELMCGLCSFIISADKCTFEIF